MNISRQLLYLIAAEDETWWQQYNFYEQRQYIREHPHTHLKITKQPAVKPRAKVNKSIGHAVLISNIPDKYKDLPIIGQGATSVVLDAGHDKTIMLTRDQFKTDWLCEGFGAGIGKQIGSFVTRHTNPAIREMPINVLELPKLHQLSAANHKIVKKVIEELEEKLEENAHELRKVTPQTVWQDGTRSRELATPTTLSHFREQEGHLLQKLSDWLINYDPADYGIDLSRPGNFMQDSSGKIVVVDPIVDRKIWNAFMKHG